jgi:hypothetical protein
MDTHEQGTKQRDPFELLVMREANGKATEAESLLLRQDLTKWRVALASLATELNSALVGQKIQLTIGRIKGSEFPDIARERASGVYFKGRVDLAIARVTELVRKQNIERDQERQKKTVAKNRAALALLRQAQSMMPRNETTAHWHEEVVSLFGRLDKGGEQ